MPVFMEASQSPNSVSEKHVVGELTLQLTCGGIGQAAAEVKAVTEAKAKAEAEAKAAAEKAAAEKAAADAKVVILTSDYFTICVFFRFGEWKESKLMPF
jgi:hypothetical protein